MSEPSLFSFWSAKQENLFHEFATSPQGLTHKEVTERLQTYGENHVGGRAKPHVLPLLWSQCKNPLVFILAVAVILSFFLGKIHEAYFVLAAILINIALGFWQEWKANNAISKLDGYITKRTRVRRNGALLSVDATHIVPGDIILFRNGDRIAADVRLLTSQDLEVDESLLTGESLPVKKSALAEPSHEASLTERNNMAWGGTVVVSGNGEGLVVATGNKTELGTIAELVGKTENEKTPLEKGVTSLARGMSLFLIVLGAIILVLGLHSGYALPDILLITIAVIVSAVPESLPIALSVVLALGAESLAKKKGVVRKMAATETLGTTSLILTDKTGTLTESKLSLLSIDAEDKNPGALLVEAYKNTDVAGDYEKGFSGRPLEVALATELHTRPELTTLAKKYTVLRRLPFTSTLKYSAILFADEEGKKYISLLGAPDILIEKSHLSQEEKNAFHANLDTLAEQGERILGVVHKEVHKETDLEKMVHEGNFSFRGVIRFRDPVRSTVPDAVAKITHTGVRVVMVTGDHPGTAAAIAKEVGILTKGYAVLTGKDIEGLSDDALREKIATAAVFARTTPEQKLRLVEAFTKNGEVVAVTGDGVNDAPALKQAAIGVAMGTGTDVARGAADIVVLDDNFETIVEAIFEGRSVLRKMRTVITYLLADSFDELMLIGGSLIVGLALPLTAFQILFVKFFSDIFPAMAFTFEKIDGRTVAHLERRITLFDRNVKLFTFGRGIVASTVLFVLYYVLLGRVNDPGLVRTFIFAAFSSYMLFLAFSMRRLDKSIFHYKIFSNHYLTGGVALGFVSIMLAIYLPSLGGFLGTTPLPLPWLLGVVGVGIANLIFMEFLKYVVRPKRA